MPLLETPQAISVVTPQSMQQLGIMGLKVAAPDGSLSGMVSVFELTRQNVATLSSRNSGIL